MPVLFATYPCEEPAVVQAACYDAGVSADSWFGRPNQFRHVYGKGPGRGWLLMNWSNLKNIDRKAAHDLVFWDDSNKVTLKKIEIARTTCVVPSSGATDQDNEIYLVEVVDRRHQLGRIPAAKAYNVRKPDGSDYHTGSKNGGSAWTWTTLATDLWDSLSLGVSFPGLGFTPHGTPEQFDFQNDWYALAALDNVLTRLGSEFVYDPIADTFSIQRFSPSPQLSAAATAWDDLEKKAAKEWDTYAFDPFRFDRPEKINVLFLRFPPPTDGTSLYQIVTYTPAADPYTVTGSYLTLYDDLGALGTNVATMSARAIERGDDWLRIYLGVSSRKQRVYAGFWPQPVTLVNSGELFACSWEDRGAGPKTVIESVDPKLLERWRSPFAPPSAATGNPPLGAAITVVTDASCDPATGELLVDYGLAVTSAPLQVAGRVTTGGVGVSGRTIQVRGVGGGSVIRTTTTNASGYYLMDFDPPSGTYEVWPGSGATPSNYALVYSSSPAYLTGRDFTV